VLVSYPPELIDFDSTDIPQPIVATLAEALTCHAHACYRAAAMMVRRTLEELCHDRGAQGRDLKARIKDLETKVTLAKDLMDGLDELRVLGNDAAHIESRDYDQIGQKEVELAVRVTKVVLQSVYQQAALVRELKALKTTS
jgi:hypothetical protein